MATPNRSAGRLEDWYWDAFRRWAADRGMSNSDAQRAMIKRVTGCGDPPPDEEGPAPDGAGPS